MHFGSFTFELLLFTDQTLDVPDFPSQLRRKCLGGLCWTCGRHALLPKSLQISLSYNRSDHPLYRGGYADVWKGKYQGRHVAVKVLGVSSGSDFDHIMSVGSYEALKGCANPLTSTIVEILQGGCDMEGSSPSKRATFVGGDNGHSPLRDGIGVDGQWEHQRVYQSS